MQKKFCDICEEPAIEYGEIAYLTPVGEEYVSYVLYATGTKTRCKIVVKAVFSFEDHKAGFGGPPDLCQKCISDLLEALVKKSK